ncbi:MAG: S-layer homology domain-containing protein, partial [Oscillospiraceae bacterium]|nr:S-layer homology domain-containing protein [Oscillospiraceae bacterium]
VSFYAVVIAQPAEGNTIVNVGTLYRPDGTPEDEDEERIEEGSRERTDPGFRITKSATGVAVAGEPLTYTLIVENVGDITITGLVVTDPLPPQLRHPRELVLPSGAVGGFDGQTLRVTLASLEPGESATITFVVTVAPGVMNRAVIRNTATVHDPITEREEEDEEITIVDGLPERQAYLIGVAGEGDPRPIHPQRNITRAEIATVFFRLISDELRLEYWEQQNPFDDVQLHQWHNNAISTMTNMGLFEGVGDNIFAPRQSITRGELAAVMARFFTTHQDDNIGDFSLHSVGDHFNDIANHWARDYINLAAENGWVQGPLGLGGPFNPREPITRTETAAMINRIFDRLIETPDGLHPDMIRWPDSTNYNAWYFIYIQVATNSYTYHRRYDNARYKFMADIRDAREWQILERPESRPEHIFGG